MTRLIVHGASGRMGSKVLQELSSFSEFTLAGALVSKQSRLLKPSYQGGECQVDRKIVYSANHNEALEQADCVIDFSCPEATLELVHLCARHKRPVLVGTTGLSMNTIKEVQELAKNMAVLLVPNTSLGAFVLGEVTVLVQDVLSKQLGENFDLEILDIHHRGKRDAPSGTALRLASRLSQEGGGQLVTDRSARSDPRREGEIGIASIRGGDVAGEHKVYFLGEEERLEFSHTIRDRAVFARGALKLMSLLLGKPPGFYGINDLIRISLRDSIG